MAYKNLINVSGLSESQVWRHLCDWLTSRNGIADYSTLGLGWTLHDSSYANNADTPTVGDWVVLYSSGEDGKQDLYIRLLYSTVANSIVRINSGLYWNSSTNAWVSSFPGSDQAAGPTSGTVFNLYIYGSLDHFSVVVGNGTTLYGRYFGLGSNLPIATTTSAISSGSVVVVPVDVIPESWRVGDAVFVRDIANIKKAVISDLGGTNVTLGSLTVGFSAGAKISRGHSVYCSTGTGFIGSGNLQVGGTGVVASIATGVYNATVLGYGNPDSVNGCHTTEYNRIFASGYLSDHGVHRDILNVSSTGITSGAVYQDFETGENWRALSVYVSSGNRMLLFREV